MSDIELFGMDFTLVVNARTEHGQTVPHLRHRIDPRCVSLTVPGPGVALSAFELRHVDDCRCGVPDLERLVVHPERSEP